MQKSGARSSSTPLAQRRWTVEDARQALAAMDRSGLSLRAFAIREGLDPQRLTRWRRQLASLGPPPFEEVMPIVAAATLDGDAVTHGEGGRGWFEIVLPSGRMVRVPALFEASALRRLLAVVDEGRAC
jgi:transposase-like protein